MIELIIAVGIAVFISAGCSLFEAVLYSVPVRHVEALALKGKSSGKILKGLRENIDRPITAILSLNTIAHTAGAAVAGSAATAVFGHHWLGWFTALFTLAILIFSEVIPKTAGVVYARSLAPFVAHPLKVLVDVMAPAIWLGSHITKLFTRNNADDAISSDELKTMARLSLHAGGIKEYQESIIDNVLSLDAVTVKDVMTPRTVIFSLNEHLTLEEVSKQGTKWEHSRFPVYDKDIEDIVGIVLTKELFIALAEGRNDARLTDIMMPVHFVVETAKLNNILIEFIESRQKLFVIIDEYGGLAGLISLEDILEEILGREIIDESDQVADKRELARQRRSRLVSRQPREN